jgi:methionyl-tRNA formyltransferase
MSNIRSVFFGTAPLAPAVLDALLSSGQAPALIIAGADRIDSRTKAVIFPPEKVWALGHNIAVLQPLKLDADFIATLKKDSWDVFIVASYGKLLRREVLDIPAHGVINVHPSLLPRLRGPSPVRTAILEGEQEVGVSIMLLDEAMDHGPILAQKKVPTSESPMRGHDLDMLLASEGAALLADILPLWCMGEVEPHPQNEDLATYCHFFQKEDGLINLTDDATVNLRKIRALEGWPGTYTYFMKDEKQIRVKIIDAEVVNGALQLIRIVPEDKREMSYEEFVRSGATVV